jgi:hypothetical protein
MPQSPKRARNEVPLDSSHRAVRDFARVQFEALNRQVIYRLQRIDASGIFGDDYNYKSIWDEFCHEVQEGPHELLEEAWDSVIQPCIREVMGRLAKESAVLLSAYAIWDLGDDTLSDPFDGYSIDAIRRIVESNLKSEAANRSLEHLRPF